MNRRLVWPQMGSGVSGKETNLLTLGVVTLISLCEINVTVYSVTLARTIWLPDDGLRTETCRERF